MRRTRRSYPGENNGQRSESLQKGKNGPVLLLLFLLKESSVSTSAPHQHQKTTSGAKLQKPAHQQMHRENELCVAAL